MSDSATRKPRCHSQQHFREFDSSLRKMTEWKFCGMVQRLSRSRNRMSSDTTNFDVPIQINTPYLQVYTESPSYHTVYIRTLITSLDCHPFKDRPLFFFFYCSVPHQHLPFFPPHPSSP